MVNGMAQVYEKVLEVIDGAFVDVDDRDELAELREAVADMKLAREEVIILTRKVE